MTIETKELSVLKGQISKLENLANTVTITSPEENATATDLKAKLKEMGKTLKERKEQITKPLNEALKSARELFAPLESQFEAAEKIVGNKLLAYKQKTETEARAKEKEIADKLAAEQKKLDDEVAAGKLTAEQASKKMDQKLEKAEDKIDNLAKVDKHTDTKYGKVQFRMVPKLRVLDEQLIPEAYWVIDMVKLRQDVVLAKMIVPGAERYEEETV